MSLNKLAAGVALTTLATLAANGALAQSTASQVSEVVVTTSAQRSTGGLAVQIQVAKDQSIVTSQFIATQTGSSNVAQLVNLMPGVSYSSDDSTGLLSNDLRIHGFDGNRISLTVDGTPLNDTGNYAVYPGEYPVAEVVERETVNMGGNEVDSPSASALGATINIVTKIPQAKPGFQGSASAGNFNYVRGYAELDTGEFTPWGTKAYFSANYTHADKTKGNGDLKREGFEGRIYQPLRDKDFISIAGTWVSERSYFYESSSLAQYALFGYGIDWNTQWAVPGVNAGKADTSGPNVNAQPGFEQAPIPTTPGSSSNAAPANTGQGFWATHPNPVDFGDIRVQSRFDLSHGFTLTFDPYFFYTLANGGGITNLSEKDARLIGNSSLKNCQVSTTAGAALGGGVDLNGDGDCLDSVVVYSPSNTQTDRWGLNTSLLYDLDDHNHFQLAYTLDYGNHRQTGAFGTINQQTGFPTSFFGGLDGQGYSALDGAPIRKRDRFSVAKLNQFSANYIGRWMDDKLHVNLGVRYAMFERQLNQYCYLYNGATEYCDTFNPTQIAADQAADNAAAAATIAAGGTVSGNAPLLSKDLGVNVAYNAQTHQANFRLPFRQVLHYNKAMPNLGASWNFNTQNQVYFSYTQGFAAPRTDNLYTSSPQGVQPETTDIYAAGYRYRGSQFTFTGSLWGAHWHNHIVQSVDPNDPTLSIDRNVGDVTLYGIDAEGGFRVNEHVTLYGSYTWEHSQLDNNYVVSAGGKAFVLPVKGKELILTPDMMGSGRVQVTAGDFNFGLQGKYTGPRYVDDMNSQTTRIAGYATADFDMTYAVPASMGHVLLQFNASNLFNTHYYARASTVSSSTNQTAGGVTYFASTPFFYTGDAPSYRATMKVKF
jgi:iron complex outermembrane receptor protein